MEKLILKYLDRSISEEEKVVLQEWLKSPENQKVFKEVVKIHELLDGRAEVDTYAAFEKVATAIQKPERTKTRLLPNWLAYAAVFVGVVILGWGVFYLQSPQKNTLSPTPQITLTLADGTIRILDPKAETDIVGADGKRLFVQKNNQLNYVLESVEETSGENTLTVPLGQTFQVILSDSTKVTLNAGSELTFPASFKPKGDRRVSINGEAYFDVSHKNNQSFVVEAPNIRISVLGTEFNVDSYKEDNISEVVLVQGKVITENLQAPKDVQVLNPGEKASLENNLLKVEQVNVNKYVAWKDGQLVFVDDPFSVVKNRLHRKFNLKIQNNYPLLETMNFTATFRDETISDILKTFKAYQDFEWHIKDGWLIIDPPKK